MTDDEILRAEMVSQLCMNDRTHSSLLDLISFINFSFSDTVFIGLAIFDDLKRVIRELHRYCIWMWIAMKRKKKT